MVTVDEIRERVEAADQARIAKRADAAARVAEGVGRRAELVAALAEQDAVLASALSDARAVLTDDELFEFTGLSRDDLPAPTVAKNNRRGRKAAPRSRSATRPARTSAATIGGAPDAEAAPGVAAVPAVGV